MTFRALQVINAKSPQAMIGVEGEDARIDARYVQNIDLVHVHDTY